MKIDVRRVVFPAIEQVAVDQAAQTFDLGPEDVLIGTEYSLVSAGTELAKLSGLQKVDYPFVPGNRAVGKVLAVGSAVRDLQPGIRVFSHIPHASHALATRLRVAVPDDVEPCMAPMVGLALVGMTAVRVGQVELGDRVAVIGLGVVGNLTAQLLEAAGAQVIGIDLVAGRLEKATRLWH